MYSRELQNKLLELSEHEYRLYRLRKVHRGYASDKLPAYSKEIDLYTVVSIVHAGSVVFTMLPAGVFLNKVDVLKNRAEGLLSAKKGAKGRIG